MGIVFFFVEKEKKKILLFNILYFIYNILNIY